MAPVFDHQPITQIFPNVYWVQGSIKMGLGMRMNRNMIILKDGPDLILINPVRLKDSELEKLDALGLVKRIFRLGDFHGLDDEFYLNRYQCEFWAQEGQTTYPNPKATHVIKSEVVCPHPFAKFFVFETALYPEAAIYLSDSKLLITTDSVQFHQNWKYFTWFTKFAFKLLGFKLGVNIGPPWLKRVTPKGQSLKSDFDRLLSLDFENLIAAHGALLKLNAKEKLKKEVNLVFK